MSQLDPSCATWSPLFLHDLVSSWKESSGLPDDETERFRMCPEQGLRLGKAAFPGMGTRKART